MENKDYIKNIERRIREIVKDYQSKGYTVIVNPKQSELPSFIKGFQPDIIAKREDENVLIEVKTKTDRADLRQFESLAAELQKKKNWRFEVVFTNPKSKPLALDNQRTLNDQSVNRRIAEINKLINYDSFEAAFLLSWATIEAVLRQKLTNEKSATIEKQTLSVIRTMFSLGLLNQRDYKLLQEINQKRNHLIHGFNQPIDKKTILDVLHLINNLTGKNRESELLDWLNAIDLENYEEIYSLYRAVADKDNYGLFEVQERQNKLIVKASHIDETLEFDSEEELKKFADLIEEEYMDDMDPEGWYGFHRAMEKDD